MTRNVKNAWKEKKLGQNADLLDLEMIDYITDAKNAIKYVQRHQKKLLNIFRFYINFVRATLIFFLLLGKGYYPYEDTDSWEKFEETIIPPKEAFYSELNLEGISDAECAHV